MKFCLTCWVENIAVAEKVFKNWLSVLEVFKYSEVLCQGPIYDYQIYFFKTIADRLQTFLNALKNEKFF